MDSGIRERYRRWFEYEKESHAKVLASLEAVPEDLRAAAGFDKAVQLMAHLVAARRLWLYRFGASDRPPAEFFPRPASLADLSRQVDEMHTAWERYLEALTDAEAARAFEYRALDGGRFRSRVEDILTQLFGHSWYHRGQIALLLRSLGAEPAVTDFVYWAREPVADRGGEA